MFKQILVAVDGSKTSDLALGEAVKLAGQQRAGLRIVHVVDARPAFGGEPEFFDEEFEHALTEAGRKMLEQAAARAAEAGLRAETALLKIDRLGERVAEALASEAKACGADLVVIGTHGRRGFSHLFLGSVAEGLARIAPVPVLLVRGR